MDILILGNGFDLDHGLKTKYVDFLDFSINYKNNIFNPDLSGIGHEFHNLVRNNFWIDFFYDYTLPLRVKYKNWIDFEKILSDTLATISLSDDNRINYKYCTDPKSIINFNPLTQRFVEKLFSYSDQFGRVHSERTGIGLNISILELDKFKSFLYSHFTDLIRSFELYCLYLIDNFNSKQHLFSPNMTSYNEYIGCIAPKLYVINFNYTPTFELLYDNVLNHIRQIEYLYLHGKCSKDINSEDVGIFNSKSKLVLGTPPFDSLGHNFSIPNEFHDFQKYIQRFMFKQSIEFQNFLDKLEQNTNKLHFFIFGHSLDISDHDILKQIFMASINYDITLFYHDRNSFFKYLYNMELIIGKDNVNRRIMPIYIDHFNLNFLLPQPFSK